MSSIFENERVPVYEFTTQTNGKTGYSIVIADTRIAKVLISVEQGTSSDTLLIEPLKYYFRSIPEFIKNDLDKYYQKEPYPRTDVTTRKLTVTTYYAFLPTLWNQYEPYNWACPLCYGSFNSPAGCVPIAFAQIMAYHRKPSSLNWTSILSSPTVSTSSPNASAVASFIAEIGDKAQTDYDCFNGSGTLSTYLISTLSYFGYISDGYKTFSLSEVILSLSNSRPVFMGGFMGASNSYGHAWVCDGYKKNDYGGGDVYEYLSINWGEGPYSNGFYYLDNPISLNGFYYNLKIIPNIR
jgi:hypothetical protein